MPLDYIRPYGLTNVSLASRNPRRSAEFYAAVLPADSVDHDEDFVQLKTPGSTELTVFEHARTAPGRLGGAAHFGFRVASPADVATAVTAVRTAGGEVVEQGELVDGQPYLFARDPDGYMFELWYEV